ncbi:MAG: hypothetical protein QOD28_941 [Acidobacteriota bacterium]|nr:hypothetical protein [Acidobacteriota bacterium]
MIAALDADVFFVTGLFVVIVPSPPKTGDATKASTLTRKRNAPSCCTPRLNSTLIEASGAICTGVIREMPEFNPPPNVCNGVSVRVPATGTSAPVLNVTVKFALSEGTTRRSACPLFGA